MFQSVKSMRLSFEIFRTYNLFLPNGTIKLILPKNWTDNLYNTLIIKYLLHNHLLFYLLYIGSK
jgi:hypothetical protein